MDNKFTWTSFYMELATKLLEYKNNRTDLFNVLEVNFRDAGIKFPFKEKRKKSMKIYVFLPYLAYFIKELLITIELLFLINLLDAFLLKQRYYNLVLSFS